MNLKYLEMKEKYDDLAEKMRFFERVCRAGLVIKLNKNLFRKVILI